jgi:hypothetical protein
MEALWLAFASKMCDPAWLKCEEAAEQVQGKKSPNRIRMARFCSLNQLIIVGTSHHSK